MLVSIHLFLFIGFILLVWSLQDKEMVLVQDDIIQKVIVKPQTDKRIVENMMEM